jgi:hypothetical protein
MDPGGRRWTHREVALWLLALIFVAASGYLFATDTGGPWVLVPGVIGILVALMRYRGEARPKREPVEFTAAERSAAGSAGSSDEQADERQPRSGG